MGSAPGAVRAYRPADEAAGVEVWVRAGKAVYDFLPAWRRGARAFYVKHGFGRALRDQPAPGVRTGRGVPRRPGD